MRIDGSVSGSFRDGYGDRCNFYFERTTKMFQAGLRIFVLFFSEVIVFSDHREEIHKLTLFQFELTLYKYVSVS